MSSTLYCRTVSIAALCAGMACAVPPARAEDGWEPLVLTVRPSGVEIGPVGAGGETLDQKLARRDKLVRYICLGCLRADGRVDDTPFFPIRTLNAPQLNAALDGQP